MTDATFKAGDRVTWICQPMGGYLNLAFPVPAVVVRVTAKRITIDADLKNGKTKRISVRPDRVFPRGDDAKR